MSPEHWMTCAPQRVLSCVSLVSAASSLHDPEEQAGEESLDFSWDSSLDISLPSSWEEAQCWYRPFEEAPERSYLMTLLSFADCCRHLSIDPKTLRRWLATTPFTLQSHPLDARHKGLTEDQLCWLATAHHRSLPVLLQEPLQHAPAPSAEALALPDDLLEVFVALRALPAQLAALQEQIADLTHLAAPATTTRCRAQVTSKATTSRRGGRGRTTSRQPQRPSKAQVLALVEYAGEGHYVVISPKGGLLPFEPEGPAWFAWLSTCSSFRFVGKLGRLTAHREIERVRKGTWRAHRNIRNHTYNVRLGITEDLTIAALEQAAAALHAHL
jgi:hypothetical protein